MAVIYSHKHGGRHLQIYKYLLYYIGAKGDRDFWISDLVKNPGGTLTTMVNFGEVRRAQLAKSTLFASTLVPLGSLQIF